MSEDDLTARFRPQDDEINMALSKIRGELKERTSHRKTSINQALNFAVRMAEKYLEDQKEEIEQHEQSAERQLEYANKGDEHLDDLCDF